MKYLPFFVLLLAMISGPVRAAESTNLLAADTEVTFSVDMRNATRADGTPFSPFFEGVWLNGDFAGWWPWGSSPTAFQMADDDGDGIYTLNVLLPAGASAILEYKYGIDSLNNEAGTNWTRVVKTTGTYGLPVDVFGQIVRETGGGPTGEVGAIAIRKGIGANVILSWNGGTGIRVQRTLSLAVPSWSDVSGTLGVSTITLPSSEPRAFFRLFRP